MTYPAWPASLPQSPQQDGFSFSPKDNRVSFTPSVGPDMHRLRSTVEVNDLQSSYIMDRNQLSTWRAFYADEINQGAATFTMRDPVTGDQKLYKITGRWSMTPREHNWWNVQINMMEVPV